jgi:D-alanyl-D-alanine carboxypeptidase (penicillin-binding protein 5/6)
MFLRILLSLFLSAYAHISVAKLTPPVELEGRQFLVIDSDTDTILFAHNADQKMFPSSMTKVLTAYLIFEQIQLGNISLDSEFKISRKASKAEGTKMYLPEGKTVRVSDLIQGIFVASGNDACICAAENIAGNEEAFVEKMNQKLQEFECNNSHFVNTSGLPHEDHYSTCQDLYKIAKRLYIDFPQYRHFFSQQTFTFGKGTHKNLISKLLKTFKGADGLKTGHTKGGGYGVITTAIVNQQRIFVERNRISETLLNWAYQNFHQVHLFYKDKVIANLDTWMGSQPQMPIMLKEDILLTLPKVDKQNLSAELVFNGPLEAPLAAGERIGDLVITIPDQEIQVIYPVYAQAVLTKAGYLQRLPILHYLLFGKNK